MTDYELSNHDYSKALGAAFDAMRVARFTDGIEDDDAVAGIGILAGQMKGEAIAQAELLIEARARAVRLLEGAISQGSDELIATGVRTIDTIDARLQELQHQL